MNDDLRMLGEMRRDTPALDQRVKTMARAQLMAELTGSQAAAGRRRRPRFAVRAMTAGGLAVAVAAAVIVAQNAGADHRHPGASGGVGDKLVANVKELTDNAARVAAGQPYRTPRPHQWVYTKGIERDSWTAPPQYNELWTRVDGNVLADITPSEPGATYGKDVHPGKVEEHPGLGYVSFADFATLPTEPAALLKWASAEAKKEGKTPRLDARGTALLGLTELLILRPPPKLAAAAFHALGTIPGVTARRGARDVLGRSGVAFAVDQPAAGQQLQLLLDPTTYRYLGSVDVMLAGNELNIKAGTVYSASAEMTYAIVDHPGQRP